MHVLNLQTEVIHFAETCHSILIYTHQCINLHCKISLKVNAGLLPDQDGGSVYQEPQRLPHVPNFVITLLLTFILFQISTGLLLDCILFLKNVMAQTLNIYNDCCKKYIKYLLRLSGLFFLSTLKTEAVFEAKSLNFSLAFLTYKKDVTLDRSPVCHIQTGNHLGN